ncbi:MAG: hypothetical protein OXG44_05080 [Gammaproteobacteria bacterium]|nr:hypothetical protein [Gammaproteobacteria bacterium]
MNHLDRTAREVLGTPPFDPGTLERQRWLKLSRLLVATVDNVEPGDRVPLAALCESQVRERRYQEQADADNGVALSADGTAKTHPALAAAQRERTYAATLMHALRLTPKSRHNGNAKRHGLPEQGTRPYHRPNTPGPANEPDKFERKRAALRELNAQRRATQERQAKRASETPA